MRQIIDYYYVVNNDELLVIKDALQREFKHLGLWKFARAVMYVLHEALGLSEEKMIAPIDEKRGKLLLAEILNGGNFGSTGGYDTNKINKSHIYNTNYY